MGEELKGPVPTVPVVNDALDRAAALVEIMGPRPPRVHAHSYALLEAAFNLETAGSYHPGRPEGVAFSLSGQSQGNKATGPSVGEAGAPKPETDVVTVELTREEAEKLEAFIDDTHPSTATGRARDKIRAALERTGK